MLCPNCGADAKGRYCEYCGSEMPYQGPSTVSDDHSQHIVINNYYTQPETGTVVYREPSLYSDKNKWVAFLLCLFFGYWGLHYFYVGKILKGILFLITFGFFGIGWLIDLIVILAGGFSDKEGKKLK